MRIIIPLLTAAIAFTSFAGELYVPDHPRRDKPNFANWGGLNVPVNYDDSKADKYRKLDILREIGGERKITSARQWLDCERPKVVKFLETEQFGKIPPRPEKIEFKLVESSDNALDGIALRRQYKVVSTDANGTHTFNVLLYCPKNASKETPVPCFVYPNYAGNHTASDEPEVLLPESDAWIRNNKMCKVSDNKAHEYQRGTHLSRHPNAEIVARGYAVATFCYCELYPDLESGKDLMLEKSVYRIFNRGAIDANPTSIPAWAWGDCRVLDLLETLPFIDRYKIGVAGHSRLGKTAMFAAVCDPRFAMSVSNSSCAGGAAMALHDYGENFKFAARHFTRWYQPKMIEYGDNPESLPVDAQHFIAAIAPRLVYVLSGTKDYWADPKGEFLSLMEAAKIYALFGSKKMPTMDDLRIKTPFIGDGFGYVLYDGPHQIDLYNWNRILDFADANGWVKKAK